MHKLEDTEDRHGRPSASASSATATATATIAGGAVTSLTLSSSGSGYTAVPTVTLMGGGGNGAMAEAFIDDDGSVSSLTLIKGGSGYSSAPTVDISLDGGAALLSYAFQPTSPPLEVSEEASFTLLTSNSGSKTVYCAAITVTLPPAGELAQDLTNSLSGITVTPGDSNPDWISYQSGGVFTLTPNSVTDGTIGATGLYFTFSGVTVNDSVGTCTVTIGETASSSSQPSGNRIFPSISLNKWPQQFSIQGPTANPVEVGSGGSTWLDWTVEPSNLTCTLMYDPDGNGLQSTTVSDVGNQQFSNLTNPNGVVFTLQVTVPVPGQDPLTTQSQVTVQVQAPQPVINSFDVTTQQLSDSSYNLLSTWATEDATYCTMSGSTLQLDANSAAGTLVPTQSLDLSLTLTAHNGANMATSTIYASSWMQGSITSGLSNLEAIVASLDGQHLYLAQSAFNPPAVTLLICSTGNGGFSSSPTKVNWGSLCVGGIALSPNGACLYAVAFDLPLTSHSPYLQAFTAQGVPVGLPCALSAQGQPCGIVASPDNTRVYVLTDLGNTVLAYSVSGDPFQSIFLQPIGQPYGTSESETTATGFAVSPDGGTLFVGQMGGVALLQTSTDDDNPIASVTYVKFGSSEQFDRVMGLAWTTDYRYLVAVTEGGKMLLLNPSTAVPEGSPIAVGGSPTGIATQGSSIYIMNADSVVTFVPSVYQSGS